MTQRRRRPIAHDKTVMVIPRVHGGEPHVLRTGTLVREIVGRFLWGFGVAELREHFDLTEAEVNAVLRYELRRRERERLHRQRVAAHALVIERYMKKGAR